MISLQLCRLLRPYLQLALISFLGPLLCSAYALSAPLHPSVGFKPQPKVDSRGFIDVWQLRRDVAAVEPLMATEDTDSCYSEGNPDAPELSKKEMKALERSERACVAEVERHIKAYRRAFDSFNKAWLPVLVNAARRGDKVAEVILRQCDTTPVLDRSQIESTCDEDPNRREIAIARLKKTGFEPAFAQEVTPLSRPNGNRDPEQMRVFQDYIFGLLRQGIFGGADVGSATNVNPDEDPVAASRGQVIEAALQEVGRAFTYSSGRDAGWKTDGFTTLSLNRKPLTPGFLTLGKELHFGGGNSIYTGIRFWRRDSGAGVKRVEEFTGTIADADFIKLLRSTLVASNENTERHLKEDPRWGVFVINRIGHHEWVPEGMASETSKLRSEWLGQWELETVFNGYYPDWTRASEPTAATRATIFKDGDNTLITFLSASPSGAPLQDAIGCQLRYSGGMTYLPSSNPDEAASGETVLGYYGAYPIPMIREVFKPLKSTNRYRQVLVQCPEGEWFDNLRTRFLLLAGNTMIEVARERVGMTVRHFRRVSSSLPDSVGLVKQTESAAKLNTVSAGEKVLRGLAAAEVTATKKAEQASEILDRLPKANITELISTLYKWRNESLYYNHSSFPANLKEIERREGGVAELTAAYRADQDDPVFRFNIIVLLNRKLKTQTLTLTAADKEAIANCLLDSLKDTSAWVRTEGVWGLRFVGNGKHLGAVNALLNDADGYVRNEAAGTAARIGTTPADNPTPFPRDEPVAAPASHP